MVKEKKKQRPLEQLFQRECALQHSTTWIWTKKSISLEKNKNKPHTKTKNQYKDTTSEVSIYCSLKQNWVIKALTDPQGLRRALGYSASPN